MPASDDALGAVSPHQGFVQSLLFSPKGPSTARSKRLRAEAAARRLHQSSTTRNPWVIKYYFRPVALVFVLCAPAYFYTLVQTHTHVAVTGLLFAAEALALVLNLLFFFNFWFATERNKVSLRSFHPRLPEKDWPHVDLCFTHFLEPVVQLHDPLAAALTMDYPAEKLHIKILDDGYLGKRGEHYEVTPLGLELEQMVQDLLGGTHPTRMKLSGHLVPRRHAAPGGMLVVTYVDEEKRLPSVSIVSRMKGDETFFKTGNVENALYNAALESPFVALFDGDTEPHRDFLTRTLPLFYRFEPETKRWRVNWEVGFIQTRQRFKNVAHRFGPDDPLNQSNGVFFSATQAGRDGLGMADSLGTNEIYFRPALDDALGLVYGPLSGDLATGVKLHKFGWKGLYLNAVLAEGLCRNSVGDTLLERKRWVVGSIQMLLLSLNLRALFSSRFLLAPLRLQTEARLAALIKRPERFVTPLGEDDVGYEARQMRRESFWMGVARKILFLETTLRPLGSLVAFSMIILSFVFMLGNVPPLRFFREGGGWTHGLIYLGIVAAYQFLRLLAVSLGCYSLFLDGTSGQDVWREVQGYFTFAWVSALGMVEAVISAVYGRTVQWETQKKGLRPLAELPNVVLLFLLLWSMCIAFINIFVKETTGRRTTMDALDAVAYGAFIWVCIWPTTRCTIAALVRMPLWSFKMPKFVWTAAGIVIGIAIISIMGRYAQPAPNIGAFERNDYPTGPLVSADGTTIYQNASAAFQTVFWGPNKIFLPMDPQTATYDTGGYILDYRTGHVSSQLMGYAMMIAVQMNQRFEFDRLWMWVQKHMMPQLPSPYYGYVASQVAPDGTILNATPFPDAEQYMATALMFAGSRWQAQGPDGSGDYRQAAYDILETMLYHHVLYPNLRPNATGLFNETSHIVSFQPDSLQRPFTRTASLNPAFYEVWRRFAPRRLGAGVGGFWEQARDAARVLLSLSSNQPSGLFPDLVNMDGSPNPGPNGTGSQWFSDTWMVQPNLALDVIWWDRCGWGANACARYTDFLLAEGVKFYGIRYEASTHSMLEQGLNFTQRVGLVAVNAMPAIAAGSAVNAQPFFDAVQQIDPAAIMIDTNLDRAYHGLLYLLGLLTSSGRYRVFDPTYGAGPE